MNELKTAYMKISIGDLQLKSRKCQVNWYSITRSFERTLLNLEVLPLEMYDNWVFIRTIWYLHNILNLKSEAL